MIKTVEIIEVIPYNVVCRFNNGEVRQINLEKFIIESNSFVNKHKLLDPQFFIKQAAIGNLGQLYWANAAYFKDENGKNINCEFDMSPEFIYNNSTKIG